MSPAVVFFVCVFVCVCVNLRSMFTGTDVERFDTSGVGLRGPQFWRRRRGVLFFVFLFSAGWLVVFNVCNFEVFCEWSLS